MSRPLKRRCINYKPNVVYFKPHGVPLKCLSEVILKDDEIECIRLKYQEDLTQDQAAAMMGISQSTFQRLLTTANKKIADALINGKAIKIHEQTISKE